MDKEELKMRSVELFNFIEEFGSKVKIHCLKEEKSLSNWAPELLLESYSPPSFAHDAWSIGCLMYQVFLRRDPFSIDVDNGMKKSEQRLYIFREVIETLGTLALEDCDKVKELEPIMQSEFLREILQAGEDGGGGRIELDILKAVQERQISYESTLLLRNFLALDPRRRLSV